MIRCLNDLFAYCKGDPERIDTEEKVVIAGRPNDRDEKDGRVTPEGYLLNYKHVTRCGLDIATCGSYCLWSGVVAKKEEPEGVVKKRRKGGKKT